LLKRIKTLAKRIAHENVAAPMIEYIIVLAIVLAVVITSAAYAGIWVAGKWLALTAKLP